MVMPEAPQRSTQKIIMFDVPLKYDTFDPANLFFNLYFIVKVYHYGWAVLLYTACFVIAFQVFKKIKKHYY